MNTGRANLRKLVESGPPNARRTVARTLGIYQRLPDLATLRDSAALAKLPTAERAGWRQLWADVAALRKQAEGKTK